jgi:pimeloyl-ACP methyl ester carboxylesterase
LRHLPLRGFIQRQSHRRWFPPFDRTRWQFLVDNTGDVPLAALSQRSALIRDCDLRPSLNEIQQPVLLVSTEGDGRILEDCGGVLAAGLANSKVESLNDTGQYAFLTHPHRLAKVIDAFLTTSPSKAGQAVL